jgi:histidinol-phosphatase
MDLRSFIEEIAREAGEITLKYFNQPDLQVDSKANETPVTRADREAEQYLRERIKSAFPHDSIIGEEFGEEQGTSGRHWILDPLDGTKTFIRGVPLYGTLIALEELDEIIAGVVFMPALNEIVSAIKGEGALWNGKRCNVSETKELSEACVLTTSYFPLEDRLQDSQTDALLRGAKIFRTWGDCYGHILVATGRAEVMLDAKVSIWDVAPLALIMEEAGGEYFDFEGTRTYTGSGFISSNSAIAREVIARLTDNA